MVKRQINTKQILHTSQDF